VIEVNRKILELVPVYLPAHWHLGWAFGEKRVWPQGIAACRRGIEITGDDVACEAIQGWLHARAGSRAGALDSLSSLERLGSGTGVPWVYAAIVYVGLGDHERAIRCLDGALEQREPFLMGLKVAPVWDPLRSDSRFEDLLRRMGLESRPVPVV
jgi:hypothetical protein